MKLSPNARHFCNTPWYEAHIYWDGSLGICCQESRKLSNNPEYNIRNMTLAEWFNSEPVKKFRMQMFENTGTDICSRCYFEEAHSSTSRRHRGNQKSVIFTKQAFQESFKQSPGYDHFMFSMGMDGLTDTLPIDLHIDLGNHCNLACKMCWPGASTTIATQYVKWGIPDSKQYLGVDWTKDLVVWNRFLNELLSIPKLKNIHLMGGETLLSIRFEQLVDFLILHKKFDINFSFVTNGTVYKPELIEKLKQFPRVGIEISIETATEHNNYIRQGSKIEQVLDNIKKYKQLCSNSGVSVTLRSAISALSIGYYHTLLKFALEEQLLIKSLIVKDPEYLNPQILPWSVREQYSHHYNGLLNELADVDTTVDYNESDTGNYKQVVKQQAKQVWSLLNDPGPPKFSEMVEWCNRWDQVYGFDLLKFYPEFEGYV